LGLNSVSCGISLFSERFARNVSLTQLTKSELPRKNPPTRSPAGFLTSLEFNSWVKVQPLLKMTGYNVAQSTIAAVLLKTDYGIGGPAMEFLCFAIWIF
jgi:hypothetical protein